MTNDDLADFEAEKTTFLRFADTVRKARSPKQLFDLLMADTEAPYHTFEPHFIPGIAEDIGCELAVWMGEAVTEAGLDDVL